MFETESDFLES